MEDGKYYSITTRRFALRTNHRKFLELTQLRYNELLRFYYDIYLNCEEVRQSNRMQALRLLEQLTVSGRDRQPVRFPLPGEKAPLYFRRAAVNAAIAAARSFLSRDNQGERTAYFREGVTFYKGMYRDLTEKGVSLRVWNGDCWIWIHCRLSGNSFPDRSECLSPSVILKPDRMELHVPVREKVACAGRTEDYLAGGTNLCCVQFTNRDTLAVCVVMNLRGEQKRVLFIRGGEAYANRCREVLRKIEKSQKSTGMEKSSSANRKYWSKLRNVSEYSAHYVSRQVINLMGEENAGILILPRYSDGFAGQVRRAVGSWTPLALGSRIREQLRYKTWRDGIILLETNPQGTGRTCSICGAECKRESLESVCANGHHINCYLNMARNIGRRCLESFRAKGMIREDGD